MRRILSRALVLALPLVGACSASHGSRCNPSQYADDPAQGDCDDGYACVYPTAPSCGVAYCCKVDTSGKVADDAPSCQPDPALQAICMLDLASSPVDGGAGD